MKHDRGVKVQLYSFFNLGAGQRQALAALLPGISRYPLYRQLGGTHSRSGRVRKILPLPIFDPRTVQPVTSRHTYWAIPAHLYLMKHYWMLS